MPAHLTEELPTVDPAPKRRRWSNWKADLAAFFVCVLVGSPFAVAGGYLLAEYQRVSPAPAVSNAVVPPTTAKLNIPDIIVTVRPTEIRVEKETILIPTSQVPEQQRSRSRHAKPDETPAPRHVAPKITSAPKPTPKQTSTPAPPPATSSTTTTRQATTTTTPVYDETRREFIEQEPRMADELPE